MSRLVRSAVLTNFVTVATSAGLDPYQMVAEFGLPVASLADPEARVPILSVNRLLEEAARRSGRSDFGLRLAEQRTLSNLGATAMLVREQPTVRKALEALVGYMHLHSEALVLHMAERRGIASLILEVDTGRPVSVRQGVELGIGFLHRSLRQLLGPLWQPVAISFTHAPPTRLDTHRRFFGVPVEFDQERNAIHCRVQDIEARVPTSDPTLARHAQAYLDTVAARPTKTTRGAVRECIYTMLPSGLCSADRVAARLGVDRRTLHRRLAREGESYSSMLDAMREEAVRRHLAGDGRALSDIAEMLGFSCLSAFSRWFRGRFAQSASQWRDEQAGAPGRDRTTAQDAL